MIIVRLRGGLGNQLFQYAAGRSLSLHHDVDLRFDLYTYRKHPYRTFELSKFLIPAVEATRAEVHRFTGSNPVIRYLNKRSNYFYCPRVCAQPHYHFFEDFFTLPPDIYLSGYWQSEKYFSEVSNIIRNEVQPLVALDVRNLALQNRLKTQESVSVHVRRGDYVSSTAYGSFFGALEKSYYDQAIEIIKKRVAMPTFYFFSDDLAWCRDNFQHLQAEFIDHNTGVDSYKDLLLMSSCSHNIIANSTFSWWGAWLNQNPRKNVIAPARWFRSSYQTKKEPAYASRIYNTKDLIPEAWVKI
jgi:hypothetical protein